MKTTTPATSPEPHPTPPKATFEGIPGQIADLLVDAATTQLIAGRTHLAARNIERAIRLRK